MFPTGTDWDKFALGIGEIKFGLFGEKFSPCGAKLGRFGPTPAFGPFWPFGTKLGLPGAGLTIPYSSSKPNLFFNAISLMFRWSRLITFIKNIDKPIKMNSKVKTPIPMQIRITFLLSIQSFSMSLQAMFTLVPQLSGKLESTDIVEFVVSSHSWLFSNPQQLNTFWMCSLLPVQCVETRILVQKLDLKLKNIFLV